MGYGGIGSLMKKWRAAIIGLGSIAWKLDVDRPNDFPALTHAKTLQQEKSTMLVAGCSPNQQERQDFEKAYSVSTMSSVKSMLEKAQPDLVSICSNSNLHIEHLIQCVEASISMVWLEKPPANSIRELDDVLDLIERYENKTRVLVNYQRRYQQTYNRLRSIYREAHLGQCHGVYITYSRGLETNGCHMLDMLFHVVGDEIAAVLQWVSRDLDNPSFSLQLSNGLQVMVQGGDLPYHCIDISLICEEGRVSVIQGGMKFLFERKEEHEFFPGYFRLRNVDNDGFSEEKDMLNGMSLALKDLVDSYEQQRVPHSSLVTARNTQLLLEIVRDQQGRENL